MRLISDDDSSPVLLMDLFNLVEAGYNLLVSDYGSADLAEITVKYGLGIS